MSDNIIVVMVSLGLFFSVVYTVRDILMAMIRKGFKPRLKGAVIIIRAHGECENTEALVRYALSLDADEIFIEAADLTDDGEKLVGLILGDFPSVKILNKI